MNDQDALEYEVGEGEKAATVTVEEPEQEESSVVHEHEEQTEHGSELDRVSEQVQKRIDKLTARMREAQRREQAALEYAKGLQEQTNRLQVSLATVDDVRVNESSSRINSQLLTLKQIIKKAREEGDVDTETDAQERMASLLYEQQQLAGYAAQKQYVQPAQQYVQQPVQQPVQQVKKPSVKAEMWAEKNPWFGDDRVMTYAAWGIHQKLVEEEGFDPESDEYYDELDSRIRGEFPARFNSQQNRKPRNVQSVAPATRSSGVTQGSARRTVKLSPSQVAIARKLGVPLEEYAKYVKE
ncbi:MAG: hypothetical protein EBT15_10705 [Betaproteobacteria bacterium]|nr:hypothetical protein [Betaproteobacteria bacterium]